jgi:two-component system cell cycle response regulator
MSRQMRSKDHRRVVLFIEDDPMQRELYSVTLAETFDVLTAGTGEAGYDLACARQPDAILIDILLPDIDGLEICERLRANADTARIPIVVLTGDNGGYARAHLLQSELTGVLMKPCRAERLLSAIHAALER